MLFAEPATCAGAPDTARTTIATVLIEQVDGRRAGRASSSTPGRGSSAPRTTRTLALPFARRVLTRRERTRRPAHLLRGGGRGSPRAARARWARTSSPSIGASPSPRRAGALGARWRSRGTSIPRRSSPAASDRGAVARLLERGGRPGPRLQPRPRHPARDAARARPSPGGDRALPFRASPVVSAAPVVPARLPSDLLRKYDRPGPRYRSHPMVRGVPRRVRLALE